MYPSMRAAALCVACLGLSVLSFVGETRPQRPPGSSRSDAAASSHTAYPAFGIRLRRPAGYHDAPGKNIGHVVRWVRNGSGETTFLVSIIPAGEDTMETFLERNKDNPAWAGATREETSLDGEPAVRFAMAESDALAAKELIVALHDRLFFHLLRYPSKIPTARSDMESARADWKWMPFSNPANHLQPGPSVRLKAPAVIRLPAIARPFAEEPHDKFAICDYRKGFYPFVLDLQLVPNPERVPMRHLKTHYGDELGGRIGYGEPYRWKTLRGSTTVAVTAPVEGSLQDAPESHSQRFSLALVEVGPKQVLVISCVMTNVQGAEARRYESLLETILKGLKLTTAPRTAR